jgi:hypothetical protein
VQRNCNVLAVKIGDEPVHFLMFNTDTGECNCVCHTGGCFWEVEKLKRARQKLREIKEEQRHHDWDRYRSKDFG